MSAVTIEGIDERLARIERMLTQLSHPKQGPSWVRCSAILAMTGWGKEKMRRMRENGVVKARRIGRRFEYDASSVPPMFIRNPVI